MIRETITVVTQNILLDRAHGDAVLPQSERVDAVVETLRALHRPLDVVCLQEVEGSNGRKIANALGHGDGFWFPHPHHRRNEYIGVFGEAVQDAKAVNLGFGKTAVAAVVEGVPIVGLHFKARYKHIRTRYYEARNLTRELLGEERAVLLGDFNGSRCDPASWLLHQSGFRSVHPTPQPTFPTSEYAGIMWSPWQNNLVPNGIELDDIKLRGRIAVQSSGLIAGAESDHLGRWATLELS